MQLYGVVTNISFKSVDYFQYYLETVRDRDIS